MGISKGHTFTDGETVTAAKLNNLVDNATITSDTVTTAMIQNNAITADKLATNAVTGANLASNSINLTSLSNASGGTSGTIVQSWSGGVFEEFTPGSAGTFLKSAGSDASLTWGTVDATGVDATMISGHTEITSPSEDDLLLVKDKVAGVNKSLQIQNLYKTVSDLTLLGSSDVADADEYLVIDGANPKKITHANLKASIVTAAVDAVPPTFHHVDSLYAKLRSDLPGHLTGTTERYLSVRPLMADSELGTIIPDDFGITDDVYRPFEIATDAIGTKMPHAGEIVNIQATWNSWGNSHTGGSVDVIAIDSAGTKSNNSILLSHAISTGNAGSGSTSYTSNNSFSSGTVLGYRVYGNSGIATHSFVRVLITYKFTA